MCVWRMEIHFDVVLYIYLEMKISFSGNFSVKTPGDLTGQTLIRQYSISSNNPHNDIQFIYSVRLPNKEQENTGKLHIHL